MLFRPRHAAPLALRAGQISDEHDPLASARLRRVRDEFHVAAVHDGAHSASAFILSVCLGALDFLADRDFEVGQGGGLMWELDPQQFEHHQAFQCCRLGMLALCALPAAVDEAGRRDPLRVGAEISVQYLDLPLRR
jgi:hypothetical protein